MDNLYGRVTEALESCLTGGDFRIEPPPQGTMPAFLLLSTRRARTCFASLGEDYVATANQAVDQFRGIYALRSNEWARYDLFLVLLAENEKIVVPDDFVWQFEIDPFFCRKFLLDVRRDLQKELDRLPFVPLRFEGTDVGRPTRAEAILQEQGVPKQLATYFARPHERSSDGIIDDCLAGQFGDSNEWKSVPLRKQIDESTECNPVRLESMEISNFRAYKKAQPFDLRADLVVFYGPNGLGKTSFFDAVDFLCTGSVARFDARTVRAKRPKWLAGILRHLDSEEGDCVVKAEIRIGNQKHVVQRNLRDRTRVQLETHLLERKDLLKLITGLSDDPSEKSRVDILEDLFRASHIFGQEFQSLTADLQRDSSLRSDTVSSMLALRDYVETINKLDKVVSILGHRVEDLNRMGNELNEILIKNKSELEELGKLSSSAPPPESVSKAAAELRQRIANEIKDEVMLSGIPNKVNLRSWRGAIELNLGTISQKLQKIKKLAEETPKLPGRIQLRSELQERMRDLIAQLAKVRSGIEDQKHKQAENEAKTKELLEEEQTCQVKKDSLIWLLNIEEERKRRLTELKTTEKENTNAASAAAKLRQQRKATESSVADISAMLAERQTELLSKTGRIAALIKLENDLSVWAELAEQQNRLSAEQESNSKDRADLELRLVSLRRELESALKHANELDAQILNLQEHESERQSLLAGISRYLENDICPICGTKHPSREALLRSYATQVGIHPSALVEAALNRAEVLKKVSELKDKLNKHEIIFERLVHAQSFNEAKSSEIRTRIELYKEHADSFGLGSELAKLAPPIIEAKLALIRDKESHEQKIRQLQFQLAAMQTRLHEITDKEKTILSRLKGLESELAEFKMALSDIEREALSRKVSLLIDRSAITLSLGLLDQTLNEISKQLSNLKQERQVIETKLKSLLSQEGAQTREIELLQKRHNAAIKNVEEIEKLTRELGFPWPSISDSVIAKAEELEKKHLDLGLLRDDITSFELAADAAQASAAAASLRTQVRKVDVELQNCLRQRKELEKWHKRFLSIHGQIILKQTKIIDGYIERYGPLTSIFQRRLRGVLGFGDVRLKATSDRRIVVRAERDGRQDLAPSDYFSQSQLQILMLSLFLSAALTQNWSSFSPVILDDPVTHFDDMNSYSLVDLLEGLIFSTNERNSGKQFLISTCEERFFHLLRQRFSRSAGKVIFHVFESIGRDGPKVRRLD